MSIIFIYYILSLFIEFSSIFTSVQAIIGDNVRSARENEFPFIVAIAKYFRQDDEIINYFCVGSLVSRTSVLSSEHCLNDENINGIQILVGSSYLDAALRYYPSWWVSYTQWALLNEIELEDDSYDIAVLKLISAVPRDIVPANLYTSSRDTLFGMEAKVAGWGLIRNNTIPNTLQVATLNILSNRACERRILRLSHNDVDIEPMSICTSANPYVLLRPGDSGGPLFYNNLIFGINLGTSPMLQQDFHPDQVNIHEHVTYYYNFISELREIF